MTEKTIIQSGEFKKQNAFGVESLELIHAIA